MILTLCFILAFMILVGTMCDCDCGLAQSQDGALRHDGTTHGTVNHRLLWPGSSFGVAEDEDPRFKVDEPVRAAT